MIKFLGIAFLCAAAAALLRGTGSSIHTYLPVLGGVCIAIYAVGRLGGSTDSLRELSEGSAVSEYVGVLLRALGIGYATELTADVCRSCGAEGPAAAVLLLGRAELVALACPLLARLLSAAASVMT